MESTLKILFVEDVKTDAELIWRELGKHKIVFNKLLVDNKKDFIEGLKTFVPDLIISDYSLPQFNGMQALLLRGEYAPETPFIVVTGSINETVAVECMKAGAEDYILKDNLSRLGLSVLNSLDKARVLREKKTAEAALHQSEVIFRHFMEYSPIYVFFKDENIRSVRLSNNFEKMLGKPMAELLGKNMYELFPSELAKKMVDDDLSILREGKVISVDEELNGRNYTTIKFPILIDGRTSYLAGYTIDITERKKAEEALQQNLNFSESLLKTIPFGMHIVDETGTVLFQSENLKRLCGDDSIGKKCWELYRDDMIQCSGCPLKKGIIVGETRAYESSGVLGEKVFEINHTGMLYQGKRAMLEIFMDITERKINEAELITAKEKAEESDRLKTAFLHNISHEIRTPMNAIVGFSALLGEKGIDSETRQSYIEMITEGSNHLLTIISDIVDISNIEANLVKIAKNEININSTLKSLCTQFFPKANEKNIKLFCTYGLADEAALMITDSTKLVQILSNLLSNALKFTDTGSVDVEYKKEGSFLQFRVTDTGIGIPEEYHKRVFDRFYQVENSDTRLYEGTGLGLAISNAYVQLLGGKMWLSSEPGRGTSFYFTIPYHKQAAATQEVTENPEYHDFAFKKKMRILVAEDIESNFQLIRFFLSGTNADLVRATTGWEAVDMCLSDKLIDLVLMDIKMPEMDGYSAARLIREANISIPIIAQTAYSDDQDKALESGCSGFIVKPFDKRSLLDKICEFV
jgi:PAS domain S-box-containing protein